MITKNTMIILSNISNSVPTKREIQTDVPQSHVYNFIKRFSKLAKNKKRLKRYITFCVSLPISIYSDLTLFVTQYTPSILFMFITQETVIIVVESYFCFLESKEIVSMAGTTIKKDGCLKLQIVCKSKRFNFN